MFQQGVVPGSAVPSVLRSLEAVGASGTLSCSVPGSVKKVIFWHGRVTEARSSLIDDRMGEVIYRKGKLSLDQFMHAAGKVMAKVRFGEALIASGVFSSIDLWDALNCQAREIIASLCFYRAVEVSFEESSVPPKNELLVQFELEVVLREALQEAESVDLFERLAKVNPTLVLDENQPELANCDFLRDMISLVEKANDFSQIVETESRLSPAYTTRALYELYARGILKDTMGYARSLVRPGTIRMLSELVEDINFMFVELLNAAKNEGIEDWEAIIVGARQALRRDFGSGIFLHSENGFLFENILRACVCQSDLRRRVLVQNQETRWLDFVHEKVHDILYGTILLVLFELHNRKFNSPEFAKAKGMIDRMKHPDVF